MANTKVVKNPFTDSFDFNPFLWKCSSCGKEREFTPEEIEKEKKPYPDPENHDYDFYIMCTNCKKGVMEPPTFISFM
jgi:hypothetical protein